MSDTLPPIQSIYKERSECCDELLDVNIYTETAECKGCRKVIHYIGESADTYGPAQIAWYD